MPTALLADVVGGCLFICWLARLLTLSLARWLADLLCVFVFGFGCFHVRIAPVLVFCLFLLVFASFLLVFACFCLFLLRYTWFCFFVANNT